MIVLEFSDFGEGGWIDKWVIFDGTDASFGLLVSNSVVVKILFAEWTFVLEHDCYYMN